MQLTDHGVTARTLSQFTDEQIIETSLARIIAQDGFSISGRTCLYNDGNGHRCAVGVFIGPEDYREDFDGDDGNSVTDLIGVANEYDDVELANALESREVLLLALQEIHDDAAMFGGSGVNAPTVVSRLRSAVETIIANHTASRIVNQDRLKVYQTANYLLANL